MNTSLNTIYPNSLKYLSRDFAMQVPMFNKCNLNCEFCFQNDHGKRTNDIDIDYIKQLPKIIMDLHRDIFKLRNLDTLNMTLYGGDPFADNLSDDIFKLYEEFYNEMCDRLYSEFPNSKIRILWLTNGVFTNYDRVNHILEYTGGDIYTSYDSLYRFKTETQRDMWYNTLLYYKDKIKRVTVSAIKDGLENMIAGNDRYFTKIPPYIVTDISYYLPVNNDFVKFCPSDDLIYRYIKWQIDNKLFNSELVANAIYTIQEPHRVEMYCHCYESTFNNRNPDGSVASVLTCHDTIDQIMNGNIQGFYKQEDEEKINDPKIIDKRFVTNDKRGCMYCEYDNHCQKMCYMLQNHINYKNDTGCPFKRIYKYLIKNSRIIKEFYDFKVKYK